MHPFARARERTRALNAVKMERMFAKPFVDSLEGHIDAVEVLARPPDSLTTIASGSWDGGVCVFDISPSAQRLIVSPLTLGILLHNLSTREQIVKLTQAHKGKVSGLCFSGSERLLSCGVDRNVKLWAVGSEPSETVSFATIFPQGLLITHIPAIERFPRKIRIQVSLLYPFDIT